jgi:hypothetical protein
MVRKSFFLIALISISSQSFLISSDRVESEIYGHSHFMCNQMSYNEIIELLDDLQIQSVGVLLTQECNESLRLIRVSIEKNISSYYCEEKRVLVRKLLRLKQQLQSRVYRPCIVFSMVTPLIAALSYYYWQDELSLKWKVIVVAMGSMSLLGLADYADFINYANKRLATANVVEVYIEDTINELLALLS